MLLYQLNFLIITRKLSRFIRRNCMSHNEKFPSMIKLESGDVEIRCSEVCTTIRQHTGHGQEATTFS